MAWSTPKTDWVGGDIPDATDFNRIEENISINHNVSYASFTPTLTDGTNSPTYTYQEGFYYKIGSMYYIEAYVAISSKGSCSGAIYLGNLPATSSGISARIMHGLNVIYVTGITYPAGVDQLIFGMARNFTSAALYGVGDSSQAIEFSDIADATTIRIAGWYRG